MERSTKEQPSSALGTQDIRTHQGRKSEVWQRLAEPRKRPVRDEPGMEGLGLGRSMLPQCGGGCGVRELSWGFAAQGKKRLYPEVMGGF